MTSVYSGLQGDEGGEVLASLEAEMQLDETETNDGEEEDSDMETDDLDRDFVDDPDERITNPTLYLRKYWRMVSPQPPIYHCYRDAAKRAYTCKLTLTIPPKRPRTYKAPAAYPSKRAAKRAVSEFAIANGILEEAKESMTAMDRVGTKYEPIFRHRPLPKRDERFNVIEELSRQEEQALSSSQNPVTALNLAVQRYCIETPAQALLYARESAASANVNYRLHGCTLTVRITPDWAEPYKTAVRLTSAKLAKEEATRLALENGVVVLLKLQNSFTAKVCRQMGLPIPTSLDEHDPVDEENTAGSLGQLVQEVTRNPQAMQCEYTTANPTGTELHGAILTITLKGQEPKTFEMSPCTKSKKDAKEAVCRLAVKSGMRAQLEAQSRLLAAQTAAVDGVGARTSGTASSGPPKAGSVRKEDADYLENAVAYLNLSMQAFTGKSDTLTFDFTELGPSHGLGRSLATRFGCNLTVYIRPQMVRKYTVEPCFPTKKAAKEAVARLAIKEGVVELAKQAKASESAASTNSKSPSVSSIASGLDYQQVRAVPSGYPPLQREESEISMDLDEDAATPYSTRANARPLAPLLATQPTQDVYTVSPPPYPGHVRTDAANSANPAEPASNPLIARRDYLSQTTGPLAQPPQPVQARPSAFMTDQRHVLETPQSAAEQVFVKLIEDRALEKIGPSYKSNITYNLTRNPSTAAYGATFTLKIAPGNVDTFAVSATYANSRLAFEAVASKAVHEGVLAIIDREWGVRKQQTTAEPNTDEAIPSNADKKSKDGEDPYSQPVSYLHQICQVLLGSDTADRPDYQLMRKDQGTLYGAILTINTQPVSIYKTDLIYVGKAAAKEAVSRKALEDNILEKIKDTMLHRLAPNASRPAKSSSATRSSDAYLTAKTGTQLSAGSSDSAESRGSPVEKASYVSQLDEYCKATSRPAADWKTTMLSSGAGNAEAVETSVSVKIADETFELDQSKKAEGAAGKEKLAKMVLKHLRKKDAAAGVGTKIVL